MTRRRSPFDPDHSPYGTYDGASGNPAQWRDAFEQRFTPAEIRQHLGEDSPWAVLKIPAGSDAAAIRAAYRRRARETHPDLNPGLDRSEFQRVLAAFQFLSET
jgi:DnaJ-class molecular chaperone